jgi:hypothetical protein
MSEPERIEPGSTSWRITVLPGETEPVSLTLKVDTTEPAVLRAIEQAAKRNGIVLHREDE